VLASIAPSDGVAEVSVRPAGLMFIAEFGSRSPAPQQLQLTSTGGRSVQFAVSPQPESGGNWLTVKTPAGLLSPAAESATVQVEADISGLPAGIYRANIMIDLGTSVRQEVAVALIVAPAPPTAPVRTLGASQQEATGGSDCRSWCSPEKLVLVETYLTRKSGGLAGYPLILLPKIADDCGCECNSAAVQAAINGRSLGTLRNIGGGYYQGSWQTSAAVGEFDVDILASAPNLDPAREKKTIKVTSGDRLPIVNPGGLVNGASFASSQPVAPNSIFSLFGAQLAVSDGHAGSLPLPTQLGNLKVMIDGIDAPLLYVGGSQVNGQIPSGVKHGTTATLLVTTGGVPAHPQEIEIAAARPGIFSVNRQGTGQGAILIGRDIVDTSRPARVADVVQIYCTGLGMTSPPVPAGMPAPSDPLSMVVQSVTVMIGGKEVTPQFAGLAPGFAGLYQVNAQVPAGIATGAAVPVTIMQNGIPSNTVTIAVQ